MIYVLIREGVETRDRRLVPPGVTTWRDLPLPLRNLEGTRVGDIIEIQRFKNDVCCAVQLRPGYAVPDDAYLLADVEPEPVTSLQEPFVFKRCVLVGARLGTREEWPW